MSVFRDLVNIWKSEDNLSQAWSESNDMLHLSHEMDAATNLSDILPRSFL